jgi:phytoene synthase
MLDGQRYDLFKTSYETFDELYDYCYKVASVVGLVCIRVWGAANVATAQQLAEHRGIAFQLTNILRDLVEDAQRNRVYIPAQELRLFGYDPAGFRTGKRDASFDALMRFQIDRARKFFAQSDALESYIDRSCRPTSWALMRIYRDLLDKIDAQPYRVLTQRVRLSPYHKLGIALRAKWQGKRG